MVRAEGDDKSSGTCARCGGQADDTYMRDTIKERSTEASPRSSGGETGGLGGKKIDDGQVVQVQEGGGWGALVGPSAKNCLARTHRTFQIGR